MSGLERPPSLMIIVDIRREIGAVKEAQKMGIETIGIVDSNTDPTLIDYPIPMNDDASRALEYALDLMQKAIMEGKKKPAKKKK